MNHHLNPQSIMLIMSIIFCLSNQSFVNNFHGTTPNDIKFVGMKGNSYIVWDTINQLRKYNMSFT